MDLRCSNGWTQLPLQISSKCPRRSKYRYRSLQEDTERRIIVLSPAEQFEADLECRIEHRLWLTDDLQSTKDRRAHYALMKWEMKECQHQMETARAKGSTRLYHSAKREYDYYRREYRHAKRAYEESGGSNLDQRLQEWQEYRADYEAISYAWEGQKPTEKLLCEGRALLITKNVDNLLRHLRFRHHHRPLWIDAICINQEDDTERAAQVRLMDKIYKEAKRVLVWLGSDRDIGESIISFLLRIRCPESVDSILRKLQQTTRASSFRPLQDLLHRPWFHRRWTIQEVVLGRQVSMICGTVSIEFDRFYGALYHLYSVWKSVTAVEAEVLGRLQLMYRLRENGPLTDRIELLKLLVVFHEAECSVAVDRIYSLLALGRDFNRMFSVSYLWNDYDYYWLFSRELLHRGYLLAVLSCAGAFPSSGTFESWVPDWSVSRSYLPLFVRNGLPRRCATWNREGHMGFYGSVVGSIKRTGPAASADPSIEHLASLLETWWQLYYSESAVTTIEMFLMTLTAGKVSPDMVIDVSNEIFGDLSEVATSEGRGVPTFFQDLHSPVVLGVTSGPNIHHIPKILQFATRTPTNFISQQTTLNLTELKPEIPRLIPKAKTHSKSFHRKLKKKVKPSPAGIVTSQHQGHLAVISQRLQAEDLVKLFYILRQIMGGRCCFTADTGSFGIAPASAEPGDILVDVTGHGTFVVLRHVPRTYFWKARFFQLIGDCYMVNSNDPGPEARRTERYFAMK